MPTPLERIRRIAILLLLLCPLGAVVGMDVRSRSIQDFLQYDFEKSDPAKGYRSYLLRSSGGVIGVEYSNYSTLRFRENFDRLETRFDHGYSSYYGHTDYYDSDSCRWHGITIGASTSVNDPYYSLPGGVCVWVLREAWMPYWLIALLIALPTAKMFLVFRRRYHRIDHRLCLGCGYDLRASPSGCPECGRGLITGDASR